jgi:hypothetical protein
MRREDGGPSVPGGGELSLIERGRALAALRLLGPIAAAGRLRSPAARAHLERLCDPTERAAEERALQATVPEGVEQIDPSWYTRPRRSRSPMAQRYLERLAFGRLVPMTAPLDNRAAERGLARRGQAAIDRLLAGSTERLESALLLLGRRRVAIAFTGAPRSALAQLLARLGEPEASQLVAELRAIPPGVIAEEVKAAQRALFQGGPGPHSGESAALFLRRIGCGWIAPLVDDRGDRARRLAQRLPRSLGEIILREAGQPLTEADRAALIRACTGLPTLGAAL